MGQSQGKAYRRLDAHLTGDWLANTTLDEAGIDGGNNFLGDFAGDLHGGFPQLPWAFGAFPRAVLVGHGVNNVKLYFSLL